MAKPEKVRYSGVSCMIDGILAKRVQTLGINVDINRDQATELANSGVVQYVSDTPTVTVQLDTNEVGSTDTMALLCDKFIPNAASTRAGGRAGQPGTMFTSIKVASSNLNYRTISETDLLHGYCTISATLNQDGTAAARTVVVGHAAVTGVSLNYDVSGNAAENYTLAANNKTWYLGRWAAARVYRCVNQNLPAKGLASAYSARGIYFRYLASAIPNNSSVVSIIMNNNVYRAKVATPSAVGYSQANLFSGRGGTNLNVTTAAWWATSVAWTTAGAGGFSTASSTTDRFWLVYVAPSRVLWEASSVAQGPGWELESSAGALGAVRKGQIKAYLFNSNTSTEGSYTAAGKALRLQTVSIDVALGSDQLNELGSPSFYGIVKQTPVPITVTVSALDSDLEYFATLTSTAISGLGGASGNYQVRGLTIDDFNGYNALRLEVYKENTQTNLLKTITINNMQVQSENFNVTVGGNATQEITFVADNISIVGSGVAAGTNVANMITSGWYGAR